MIRAFKICLIGWGSKADLTWLPIFEYQHSFPEKTFDNIACATSIHIIATIVKGTPINFTPLQHHCYVPRAISGELHAEQQQAITKGQH